MLKPYVCVACEKVIINQDGVPSLIGLFNKIIIAVPNVEELPKNAVAPYPWAVFPAWDVEPGDELKEYDFCVLILYPDKSQFGEVMKSKLKIETNKRSQIKVEVLGFPVGQQGPYTIRAWLEEGNEAVFGPVEFNLAVEVLAGSSLKPA